MGRTLKKIFKISLKILLAFTLLIIILYALFLSPTVQTYISQKIAKKLTEQLGAKINIKNVDIGSFDEIILEGLYIEDKKNDTLLYVERLNANLRQLSLKKRQITLDKLKFTRANINVFKQADSTMNYQFIIDFIKIDPEKQWQVKIRNIEFFDSHCTYQKYDKQPKGKGMNYKDISVANISLEINNIRIEKGILFCRLKNITAQEKSGFKLESLSAEVLADKEGIFIDNLIITTPYSHIVAENYSMEYENAADFRKYIDNVKMEAKFNSSQLSFKDLSYFAPTLDSIENTVTLAGNVSGYVSDLMADSLNINIGEESSINTTFHLYGLPSRENTHYSIIFNELNFTTKDLNTLDLPFLKNKKLDLPQNTNKLGVATLIGSIEGTPHDFLFEGKIISNFGTLSTQLTLQKKDSLNTNINGFLSTNKFDIGKIVTADSTLETISFNSQVRTTNNKNNGLYGQINAQIHSFILNKYKYKNIIIDGKLAGERGRISLKVKDDNIDLDINSTYDNTVTKDKYILSAYLNKAKLYNLNFDKEEPDAHLSLSTYSKFSNLKIDSIIGKTFINNLSFQNIYGTSKLNNIILTATTLNDSTKQINLQSKLITANIEGQYHLSTIIPSIKNAIIGYLPSLDSITASPKNNFKYSIQFNQKKETNKIFFNGVQIAQNTLIKGSYNSETNNIGLNINSDKISYNGNIIENLNIIIDNDTNKLNTSLKTTKITLNNNINIHNLNTSTHTSDNKIKLNINWKNETNSDIQSEIKATINFIAQQEQQTPTIKINIGHSNLIIKNKLWNISENIIIISEDNLQIRNFSFKNKKEGIHIESFINQESDNNVRIDFDNLDLTNFNNLLALYKINLQGILKGNLTLLDIYDNPRLLSNLQANDMHINNNNIGDIKLKSIGNSGNSLLTINASIENNKTKNIDIRGVYDTKSKNIDLNANLQKFNFKNIQPLLSKIMTDIDGEIDGKIKVSGEINKPNLNGEAYLKNASATINFLKTRYQFATPIKIQQSNLILENLMFRDMEENEGTLQGKITHNNFKDLQFDMKIKTYNTQVLNTTIKDNETFYGKAYATGQAHITGTPTKLNFNLSAKTEKGTDIYIPLFSEKAIAETSFITFIQAPEQTPEQNAINFAGINLNFDLKMTPSAKVNLIIDPETQSEIKGTGNGDLKLLITPTEGFNMYGDYDISKGDYIFSFENIVKKKFSIEHGGTIKWDGDPFRSDIELTANYRLRANPYILAPEIIKTNKKVPVNLGIQITEKLPNPNIAFIIDLPNADDNTRTLFQNYLAEPEELNRQALSLLLLNTFYTESSNESTSGNIGSITTMELLAVQLSSWLSSTSDKFDVGVSYTPKQYEQDKEDIEVEISTQILNERVQISGSAGTKSSQQEEENTFTGDVDVIIDINEKGNLKLKAYSHSNDNLNEETSPTTQGVGITYTKEFDTFGELFQSYWKRVGKLFHKETKDTTAIKTP